MHMDLRYPHLHVPSIYVLRVRLRSNHGLRPLNKLRIIFQKRDPSRKRKWVLQILNC